MLKKIFTPLLIPLFAVILLYTGCQESGLVTGPEVENDISTIDKITPFWAESQLEKTVSENRLNSFISRYLQATYHKPSMGKVVFGNFGGDVKIEYNCPTTEFKAEGLLRIPSGAYFGLESFEINFDPVTTSAHFYPSPYYFKEPLILDLTFRGLNLSGSSQEDIEFYYLAEDGSRELMEYDDLLVDVVNGILSIKGAKISHFSRYGWCR